MKLAILETGRPPGDLAARFGDYPAMFRELLGDGFDYRTYDAEAGALPASTGDHDAYLITGSPAGVYEKLPWLAPLSAFIRAADAQKLVGICFGHQIMAEALGGHVEKSAKGWGAGLHDYAILGREPWMDDAANVSVPASHRTRSSSSRPTAKSSPPRFSRRSPALPGATGLPSPSSSTLNSSPPSPKR